MDLQPKLLSFLQERSFQRIGGSKVLNIDVRIIAATHQDLPALIKKNSFREDLYFRINVIPLHIPPLRKRQEDIAVLSKHFLERIARKRGVLPFTLTEEALEFLKLYAWPGNIRELENILERSTVFSRTPAITANDLPPELHTAPEKQCRELLLLPKGLTLDALEKKAIEQALADCEGNKALAARCLGISEKSIYNKMKRFSIS